jgi:hypothetical protein
MSSPDNHLAPGILMVVFCLFITSPVWGTIMAVNTIKRAWRK